MRSRIKRFFAFLSLVFLAATLGACAGNAPNAPDMGDMDVNVHMDH